MTVSSVTSPTYTPASTSSSTPAPAGSTAQADMPTASTSVTLSALSEEAGIVATLGRASATFQTYDATGLLDQVAQAETAAAGSSGAAAPSSPDTAPANGADTPVTTAVPGDWGTLLKSNPGLTSTAVADAVAQGIVNTIDVYA
jgi:hypothetical protein